LPINVGEDSAKYTCYSVYGRFLNDAILNKVETKLKQHHFGKYLSHD